MLDDLTRQRDDDLRARVEDATELMTLLMLKNLRHAEDPEELLRGYLPLLAKVVTAPSGLASLEALMSYALRVKPIENTTLRTLIAPLGRQAEASTMSATAKLLTTASRHG